MRAALCDDEEERLSELDRYAILDTPKEPEFDAITRLVAHVCNAPIAVVNLVARGRQWFKSEVGLGVRETPIETSICAHAILQQDMLVVPDLSLDARFADNPLITNDPRLRYYAGALLRSDRGLPLGTLCVLDTRPREPSDIEIDALRTLASHVMNLLDMRRVLNAQGELRRQLEETLDSRRKLIATVAHDLRSPISTVRYGVEALRSSPKEPERVLDRIDRATASMGTLVGDLLDYERAEASGLRLAIENVRVATLVHETSDTFSAHATNAGIEWQVNDASDSSVAIDLPRVRQILANLIENAFKFTPRGGAVALNTTRVGESVVFEVSDSGPGLTAEEQSRVFEPFWRGEHQQVGVGLGLAISRRIAEALGGSLSVHSTHGKGALFRLELPATR